MEQMDMRTDADDFLDEGCTNAVLASSSYATPFPEEPPEEIRGLLELVQQAIEEDEETGTSSREFRFSSDSRRQALEKLSFNLRPELLEQDARHTFIYHAMKLGVVGKAVEFIERGGVELATAAANFLGDFAFNSDTGAQAVLQVFNRIADRFQHIFGAQAWDHLALLDSAILLCVNIAATCPSGHMRLVPLVQPVCLQILRNAQISDKLRGNTILLLANLSMTVRDELRGLGVGRVLLDLVEADHVPGPGKSVAESVIVFLHGDSRCEEVDRLLDQDVVSNYCVPIMELTLQGREFRGMYPHLLYSARLFQILAKSRVYAEALASHEKVVPLLLKAGLASAAPRVETDLEGRALALEALLSLARFRLWPREENEVDQNFLKTALPQLCSHSHPLVRRAATDLWAWFNSNVVLNLLIIGHVLQDQRRIPYWLWKLRIIGALYPCVAAV